ncbi:extracellular solute-binding protein [Streptomyces triticagri]|uniref:Extracellular solute-binding protein n=1 Tax=Streptomyces triticagri TaxID=2293568 RepID=A0A372M3I0_9ACTN|nr:extracellular solute-binding protein [Streptomyces triticagri]RFU85023.1 extracellular solute-binding protein [Streptomyces triticagri]
MKKLAACLAVAAIAATACGEGSGNGSDDRTVKVVHLDFGGGDPTADWLQRAKKQYEKENPGKTVKLQPITGGVEDYYGQVARMQQSPSTAPDVVLEDSSTIEADAQAGHLLPLDDRLKQWKDWDRFEDAAKTATRAQDGKTYGVLMASDVRALWYNKKLLKDAGVTIPWKPESWGEVLDAARAVKDKGAADVVPLNIYASKAAGEGTSMQGFEMLLYGTGDTLYDEQAKKWVPKSKGFDDALAFYDTVFSEQLGPSPQQALSGELPNTVNEKMLPEGGLAIALDGSWLPRAWEGDGWPEWQDTMGIAPMPTQDGQEPGATSMSGGFSLAIGKKSGNPDGGWDFLTTALDKANTAWVNTRGNLTTVREDVAASAGYAERNASVAPLTELLKVTHFRPALPDYPKVSAEIQAAVESVATGQSEPDEAAETYRKNVTAIVGADQVK